LDNCGEYEEWGKLVIVIQFSDSAKARAFCLVKNMDWKSEWEVKFE
jgi:hypothetical protein